MMHDVSLPTDDNFITPPKQLVDVDKLFYYHDYLKQIPNPSNTIVLCINKLEEQISTIIMSLKISP